MNDFKSGLEYAIKILNKKDYTEFEIRNRLKHKKFNDENIDDIVSKLKSLKFINDERFAENFLFFKSKRGYGKKGIAYNMKLKGLSENIIDRVLGSFDESKFADSIFLKRAKEIKKDKNYKQKLFSYMLRRGFEYDTVSKLFDKYKEKF